jgi:HEPN domain-containing protein/predicted nucleotidyltransferase
MAKKKRFIIWLSQAKYDLLAAKASASAEYHEWACYQSTQCIEKAIKAVIVHAGWRPPKVHKLGVLMGIANKANGYFEDVVFDFRKVEAYTYISRYPFLNPGQMLPPHEFITKDDSSTCIAIAADVLNKVNKFISEGKIARSGIDISEKSLQTYYFSREEIKERLDNIVDQIKTCPDLDVKKIYLYGSFAREYTRPRTTTMDILVIAETNLSFIERLHRVRDVTRGGEPIVEPLVYTPEEFNFLLKDEGEGYLESALDEAKLLWATD